MGQEVREVQGVRQLAPDVRPRRPDDGAGAAAPPTISHERVSRRRPLSAGAVARGSLPRDQPGRTRRDGRGLSRVGSDVEPAGRPEIPAAGDRRHGPTCSNASTARCASRARSRTPTCAASTTSARSTGRRSSRWSTSTAKTWPACCGASAACRLTRPSRSRASCAPVSPRRTRKACCIAT